jgi:hypothetical protein
MCLYAGASGIVRGQKFTRGKRSLHKRVDGLGIVHPLRPATPEFVESDGGAGNVLNFRQVRHDVGTADLWRRRLRCN